MNFVLAMTPVWILLIIVAALVAYRWMDAKFPPPLDLQAEILSADPPGVIVANRGTDTWSDVHIILNSRYGQDVGPVEPGKRASILLDGFWDRDGERFDPEHTVVIRVDIIATVRGHVGNYSWRRD